MSNEIDLSKYNVTAKANYGLFYLIKKDVEYKWIDLDGIAEFTGNYGATSTAIKDAEARECKVSITAKTINS